jgi:predicted neuraminidase
MRTPIVALLAILFSQCEFSAAQESPAPHPAVVSSQFIYERAPYPQCHASTIVEISPGKLVAAWFGGTRERHPDVCIYVARFADGKWSEGAAAADGVQQQGDRLPTWNPVLFQSPGGARLFLFYKVGPSPSAWWGMVKSSTDGGKNWSEPIRLPEGILGPVKNKPVVLRDGAWLAASSTEGKDGWQVHFERSDDGGKNWRIIGPVKKGPGLDAIQPSILFHKDRSLQALCRSKQGVVAQTWSRDGGETWTALTATQLPNPNSGIDAVTLTDGRQLIVYNHSGHRIDEPKGNRWPLDVAVSDDGLTWRRAITLETEPNKSGYSYPAVIQSSDGWCTSPTRGIERASSMWCSIRRSCDWPKHFLCDKPHQQDHQRPNDRHQKRVKRTADANPTTPAKLAQLDWFIHKMVPDGRRYGAIAPGCATRDRKTTRRNSPSIPPLKMRPSPPEVQARCGP